MSKLIKISAGIIIMFSFLQSASAQNTAKGSEIDTYTQVMLFVVLLLISAVFFVLIFFGDMEDKVTEMKVVQPLNNFSFGMSSAAGIKIDKLFRIAFVSIIAAAMVYLVMLIIFLKNI